MWLSSRLSASVTVSLKVYVDLYIRSWIIYLSEVRHTTIQSLINDFIKIFSTNFIYYNLTDNAVMLYSKITNSRYYSQARRIFPCGDSKHAYTHTHGAYLKKSFLQKSFASLEKHLSCNAALQSKQRTHSTCHARSKTFSRYWSIIGFSHPAHDRSIARPRLPVEIKREHITHLRHFSLEILRHDVTSSLSTPLS